MNFHNHKVLEKENARNQTMQQLQERCKQVAGLHKKAIKIMKIVELTGLSYLTLPPKDGLLS